MTELDQAEHEARESFEEWQQREVIVTRAKEIALTAALRWKAAQETLLRLREESRAA